MRLKISIYGIILLIFLVFYSLWVTSSFNEIQMSYDESRHASGAMIWYDYVRTIIHDGYMPFKTFISKYQERGYNAGWFANVDPPVDGLIRVPAYFIFGPTFFAIRITALVCAIISAILVYIIAYHITKKRIIALSSSIILLMSTLFYMYTAIQALATVPNAMMVLFWYYFTFVREPKRNYKIKLFNEISVNFSWNILIGGLFLTFATLIQYSAALFIDIFFVLYILYLIIIKCVENKKINLKIISGSGAFQIAFIAFLQNLLFLIISFRWLQYNLFEMHWLERIPYYTNTVSTCPHDLNYLNEKYPFLAYGTLFSNFTYMIHGYLQRTAFFIIFFGYTFYLLIKNKIQEQYTKKHFIIISLFFLAVYLFFSFKMSNHQIRYIVHPFPFVVIGAAYGLYQLVFNKFKKRQAYIYIGIIIIFICSLFLLNNWMYSKSYKESGHKNEELLDFLKSKPEPRFVIHVQGTGGIEMPVSWYYNPDFVMFTFMRAKNGYNPFNFKQDAPLFAFMKNTPLSEEMYSATLVNQLKEISTKVPTYIVVSKYTNPEVYTIFGNGLLNNSFSYTNLTYWTIYYKDNLQ